MHDKPNKVTVQVFVYSWRFLVTGWSQLSGHFSAMKKGTPGRDKEANAEQARSVNEFNLDAQE